MNTQSFEPYTPDYLASLTDTTRLHGKLLEFRAWLSIQPPERIVGGRSICRCPLETYLDDVNGTHHRVMPENIYFTDSAGNSCKCGIPNWAGTFIASMDWNSRIPFGSDVTARVALNELDGVIEHYRSVGVQVW